PLGRQPLGDRGEPGADVLLQRVAEVTAVEKVDHRSLPESIGVMRTPSGVANTSERSGTGCQPGRSSSGSLATNTPSPASSTRVKRVSPHATAAISVPPQRSTLSRASGSAAAASVTIEASASSGGAPARSRANTADASTAESHGLSGAVASGQTASRRTWPLWLSSQRPPV